MLKIEVDSNGSGPLIRLIGRVRGENIESLQAHVANTSPSVSLDLGEVTIVDLAVVRFFVLCESNGVELRNTPLYVREWITRERDTEHR
jgi:anti-anti-sigma regulatory factor